MRFLIAVPVLVLLVLFALSNKQAVDIGLWPTDVTISTYLSLAVPPIAAGFAVPLTGFLGTTQAYLGAVLVVSATATVLQWLPSRSRGAPA